MNPSKQCDNCYGQGTAHGFDCDLCDGSGKLPVACVDCHEAGFSDHATIVCPDGKARCEACAQDIAGGARELLSLIASRSKSVTVDMICQGALRLVHDIAR